MDQAGKRQKSRPGCLNRQLTGSCKYHLCFCVVQMICFSPLTRLFLCPPDSDIAFYYIGMVQVQK